MTAERAGVPSVGIMTTPFASAAELMGRVLGADGYAFVVVEHPISSASDKVLSQRARRAVAQSKELLIG